MFYEGTCRFRIGISVFGMRLICNKSITLIANMHIQQNNLSKQQFHLLIQQKLASLSNFNNSATISIVTVKKTIIFVQANYNTNINITVNYD